MFSDTKHRAVSATAELLVHLSYFISRTSLLILLMLSTLENKWRCWWWRWYFDFRGAELRN